MGLNKICVVLFAAFALSACSSVQKKWLLLERGQSKNDVVQELGAPDSVEWIGADEGLAWTVDSYTKCGVLFDKNSKVKDKACQTNEAAKARDAEARARAWQAMIQRDHEQELANKLRKPTSTKCTSNNYGGSSTYTNCSSY